MPDNAAEMMRMQQEAIRRVRSMQERAQRSVRSEPADSADDGAPAAGPVPHRPRLHRPPDGGCAAHRKNPRCSRRFRGC